MIKKFIIFVFIMFFIVTGVNAATVSIDDYTVIQGTGTLTIDILLSDSTVGEFDFFGLDISLGSDVLSFNNSSLLNGSALGDGLLECSSQSDTITRFSYADYTSELPSPLTNGILFSIDLLIAPEATTGLYSIDLTGVEFGLGYTPGSIAIDSGSVNVSAVPIPAALYLFGTGLLALIGIRTKKD